MINRIICRAQHALEGRKILIGETRKEQHIWLPPSDLDSQDWSAHLLMDRGLHGWQAHLYSEACQHLLSTIWNVSLILPYCLEHYARLLSSLLWSPFLTASLWHLSCIAVKYHQLEERGKSTIIKVMFSFATYKTEVRKL